MEKEHTVEAYGVHYECDNCLKGHMVSNGKNDFSTGVKIGHTCTNCEIEAYLEEKYPLVRFRSSINLT